MANVRKIEFWIATVLNAIMAAALLVVEIVVVGVFMTRPVATTPKSVMVDVILLGGFAVVFFGILSVWLNWYCDCWKVYKREDHKNG